MTRSDIIRLIGENRDRLTELKVKRLALFGSVARGGVTLQT
jgi:predicted nucleotidyltransferase